ncbi:MAG: DUF4037 domain-containing protein [Ruminococcaceae bacterium]|nr:DUF4037 domain-containing protein [Oscillospiraceae bacterium]
MKGLEIAKEYYRQFGAPMIAERFPELEGVIACGLAGDGSECFGYDDDISTDHDFEPGFCMFIPDGDIIDSRTEFRLERAYASLPSEFFGLKRQKVNPVGGKRRGVIRIGDFFEPRTGLRGGFETEMQRLSVPDFYIAAAINGEIFRDDLGIITEIREGLADIPENVLRKKLAGSLIMMAQSGVYNYKRCVQHGETGAAQLAAAEFVRHTMQAVFLLNRRHRPFYKWSFRAMRELPILGSLTEPLEYLITTDNMQDMAKMKTEIIEDIAVLVSEELKAQKLTANVCDDLEKHAYSVNDGITDNEIRNLHIMYAIN